MLQIYDISIDKVNKPFLPVASGEMSVRFAWVAVRQRHLFWVEVSRLSAMPLPQVLALAACGASIVTFNFGQLITVRCCSRAFQPCVLMGSLSRQGLYCFGLCLGTLYSVPPFRLKVSTCCSKRAWRSSDCSTAAALSAARFHDHRNRAWLSAQLRRLPCHSLGAAAAV